MKSSNPFKLSSLDGQNGFVINGVNPDDFSGASLSNAGDVNGDGIDDLIIGAVRAEPNLGDLDAGLSYVVFGSNTGFDASLELSSLDGSNGFTITGIDADDMLGRSVSSAGDFNGDGIGDLIVGAYGGDPNGISNAGESYIIFGRNTGFDARFELDSVTGVDGFVINGIDDTDRSGFDVSGAGDLNNDGIDDIVIGAYDGDPNGIRDAGESYVVFGKRTGFTASLDLALLDGVKGFTINGLEEDDRLGRSVSSAGDINGDGIDDLIIGADFANPNGINNAGQSYVIFGDSNGFDSILEVSNLDGSNGFTINGINTYDASGKSVSSAGDFNGDGIDDLIIGAFAGDPNDNNDAGESYVVFGRNTGFDASLELSSLDGTNGFVINGVDEGDRSGFSVSGAGDFNGDGLGDIIIGANLADPNGNNNAGESYLVFGSSSSFGTSFNLADLDGTNGFVLNGLDAGDYSGFASGAGDINGDGLDDIIIGADNGDPNGTSSGESYVVFGTRDIIGTTPAPTPTPTLDALDININRFQNSDQPGTFLFAGEEESSSIRSDFPQFEEEGFAFRVADEAGDDLVEIFRFQSVNNPGTFLFVGEEERQSVNANFSADFVEEGTAFFVLPATSEVGTTLFRFQNTNQPGTFLFANAEERTSILADFPQFVEEGAAFNVAI